MTTTRTFITFCCICFFIMTFSGISGCGTISEADKPKMISGFAESEVLELSGDLGVHDPVIIRKDDTYYVFCTGRARGWGIIPVRTSKDLRHWTLIGAVFERLPAWVSQEGIGARDAWAPDISYFNGKYHLYYSVSSFGSHNSAIGLVTNVTLDPNSPDYEWIDQGMVVRSNDEVDWNAIDGNIVVEDEENVWLSWGSFWSGIKMRRIDPATGKLPAKDTMLYSLCERERSGPHETPPVEGAVEAPFIVRHGKYWYLFVSFDFCCMGAESTYNIRVGRSKKVTGPYVDKKGVPMAKGGGSLVLQASQEAVKWAGPGHQAVLQEPEGDYLVFHAYSIPNRGRSMLNITKIVWEDGWPYVAELE